MSNVIDFMKERGALITKQRELEKQKEIEEKQKEIEEKEALERAELRQKQEKITKKNQSVFHRLFNNRKKPLTSEYLTQIDFMLDDFHFRHDNQGDVYLVKEILDFEHVRKTFLLDSNLLKRFFTRILPNADKKIILWFLENDELRGAMCKLYEKNAFTEDNVKKLVEHFYYAEANTKHGIKFKDSLDYRLISELLDKIMDHYNDFRINEFHKNMS